MLRKEDNDFVTGNLSPDVSRDCIRNYHTDERPKHQVDVQGRHVGDQGTHHGSQHVQSLHVDV